MQDSVDAFTDLLLGAKSYRDFLSLFFDENPALLGFGILRKPLSYAEFSRRAGFASRAFIRDILLGKKRVTLSNFDKIVRGLKLNAQQRDFFRALVALEEPDFRGPPYGRTEDALLKQMAKIRKSHHLKKINQEIASSEDILKSADVSVVFAASGTEQNGASFAEIIGRCGLTPNQVKNALQALLSSELISFRNDRYYPCSSHVAFERLGGDEFFRKDFLRTVASLKRRFETNPQNDICLFLASTFCVAKSQLPALKESLNQTLLQFISSAEDSAGDSIVELVVGLTPNSHEKSLP